MTGTMAHAGRLAALREEIARERLDGFLVPRADEHLGEYVPASAERLAWLTGFTGSAGLAVVLVDRAAVFSDGRYVLQLAKQTDPSLWEQLHILDRPPQVWLAQAKPRALIGYDPWLVTQDAVQIYEDAGIEMVPVEENLTDRVWHDRPAPPAGAAVPHPLEYAGATSQEKRHALAEILREAGQDAAVISDPASLCWLLNLRGDDVPFTPFLLGFVVLRKDGRADLFIDEGKITTETRAWLGNEISVRRRSELSEAMRELSGRMVRVDRNSQPYWFARALESAGAKVVVGQDVCAVPKACKNAIEQQGARDAQIRDGAAMARFLAFMAEAGPAGTETEISAAEQLVRFRAMAPEFRGQSFAAISGAGENGAIIHYRVTSASNRPIRPDELYLIDSGAQYLDGTTDVTRTVWTGLGHPPAELRDRYTRVLKGLIAIDRAVFPSGTAGVHLDALARTALWEVGLDFDHGTGHGIGSYLAVHEGPASISRPLRPATLEPGMIMSDEPGYYLPGSYGIRLENLVVVQPADLPAALKPFYGFETLTLAPFEPRLIEVALLTREEIRWVDAYHARVCELIVPHVDASTRAWLEEVCTPLSMTGLTPGREH